MKKVITAVVAFGLLIAVAASAPADTHSHARLSLVATGKAEIGWVKGPDSPKDPDRWALNMALNGPTGSGYTNEAAGRKRSRMETARNPGPSSRVECLGTLGTFGLRCPAGHPTTVRGGGTT